VISQKNQLSLANSIGLQAQHHNWIYKSRSPTFTSSQTILWLWWFYYEDSNFWISFSISIGSVGGPNRSRGFPFLSTKNFVKFHLIASIPRIPPFWVFNHFHRGCASFPFTFTLLVMSHVTPNVLANFLISASVPGSCPPNWLQGNPIIRRPFDPSVGEEYFSNKAVNCS